MLAPNLRLIHPLLWQRARDLLEGRSARDFLDLVPAKRQIELVSDNLVVLRRLGIYEEALLVAWTAPEHSLRHVPLSRLLKLIRVADRWKLRAAGMPLPGRGPYVLFRGVAGQPKVRRERGVSWTSKPEIAAWFARRSPDLRDPAVYQLTVEKKYVLAYWNEHDQDEYLIDLPRTLTLQRLPWGPAELKSMAGRYKPDAFDHTTRQVFGQRDGGHHLEKPEDDGPMPHAGIAGR
jgi:hypothetical protein